MPSLKAEYVSFTSQTVNLLPESGYGLFLLVEVRAQLFSFPFELGAWFFEPVHFEFENTRVFILICELSALRAEDMLVRLESGGDTGNVRALLMGQVDEAVDESE